MGHVFSSFLTCQTLGSIFSFVAGEAKYIWGLKGNLDALPTELEKLIRTREDLLNRVLLAEQQPRIRRTREVEGWLKRVEEKVTEVAELQQVGDREIDRLCLGGFCSNDLMSSYDFGKRVKKLKEEVVALKKEREDIQEVAQMIPEAAAVVLPIGQRTIIGQESIFDQVWRCIEEDNQVGIIGLYGKGGAGKTTLLKRVNNNFCSVEQHHFDVVIWSVVSRKANLKKIQDDIGKRIGLSGDSWKDKNLEDRALEISNILSQKKFVLLLDDIWEPFELTELGVPLQRSNTSPKIAFTTRSYDVCGQMQATKKLEVSSLESDEAWKLFQEVVGRDVLESHSGIRRQAKILASVCGGLPLTLITLGRTMASKTTLEEWKNACGVSFSRPPIIRRRRKASETAVKEWENVSHYSITLESEFSDMEKKVYSHLKYSYDNLPNNNKIKSCLLYCSLFPEDYLIPKEDLVNYWVSEGLVDDLQEGSKNIHDLIRACLLEEEDDDHVKMHDVIRDMALWIACKVEKEEENYLVRTRVGLTEAPKIEDWKEVRRISLMENYLKSLTEIPNSPRLQTLLLDANDINMIVGGFFQFTSSLRVLSLRGNVLYELPSEILRLVSLQHLDLSSSSIRGLPLELRNLKNLRYFNLERTSRLSIIPEKLISSFSKLEVLMIMGCGFLDGDRYTEPEKGSVLSEDAESLIEELLCLKHLNLISLDLNSSRAVQNFFNSPKLQSITRSLSIRVRDCESLSAIDVFRLASMENLKELNIYHSKLEEWKIGSTGEVEKVLLSGFRSLQTVRIWHCGNAKDLTWLGFAQNLKKIEIWDCDDVEEIVSVEKWSEVSEKMGELKLFERLEYLCLGFLKDLNSIYGKPLPFPRLKKIEVRDECSKLKKLPFNSSSAKECQIVIEGYIKWWVELQWEDEATENAFSTCFVARSN